MLGAACADELARRFNRHFDFLTVASWPDDIALGAGGLDLTDDEISACAERSATFFGLDNGRLSSISTPTFLAWANTVAASISEKLEFFSFKSAARGDDNTWRRHRADEIFQDAAAAANVLYGRRRLLSFVAPHSLIGFVLSVLTPNLQGIEGIDVRCTPPEELSATLAYGDVLIATPTLWRYMMRENLKAPDNTMAVSFGEAMAPDLAAAMRKAGFGVLRELYGSTETGLMGWRDAPMEPFNLFDHWRRDGADPVRNAPDGVSRTLPAMDFIEWAGERTFNIAGRRDGAVQVGAVNVKPDDVAQRLRQHPLIEKCAVNANKRGDGVTRLVAHIVLKNAIAPDERTARDIDAWCRTSLRQQERPRIFHFHRALD
ncbi:MAG: hypothetical protein AAGD92_10010 [Pseudomonadota bacterium]